jgi:predicted transposase YdaD
MGRVDLGGKRTITMYTQAWLEWILREKEVKVVGEASGEFQFVARLTDSLLQAQGPSGSFLALTELQWRYDPEMPERLAAYAVLARQKHRLPVYVTVVNLLPPPAHVTPRQEFHEECMGQVTHRDFQVIGLWELDAAQMLAQGNPALLPFVPLMRGGATKETVVACAERIRREPEALELETILAVFAGYVLSTDLIKQLLRWEMTIVKESPIIQELLTQEHQLGFMEGRQEGRQEGKQVGLKKGKQVGLKKGEQVGLKKGERNATLKALRQILTIRFDAPPPDFERRLEPLDLPTLGQLTTAALTLPTWSEFEQKVAAEIKRRGAETSPHASA